MKTITLQKVLTTLCCFFTLHVLHAQQYDATATIDTGNIRAVINSNGTLFEQFPYDNGFEAPKGGGVHATFAANLWMGGLDDGGQLHLAASTYRQTGDDFFPGPIATNGAAGDIETWDQLWKVGKAEIAHHKTHYADAGYVVPQRIANWPGNGPAGFDAIMAPFADLNNNGIYEPSAGDYPAIYGDQAVYFIFNDLALPHTETGALPLGFEVHGMAYAFNAATNLLLENSVFFNYTIKNKSGNNYHDLYFGLWNDFDLGCYADDYVGTDVAKNTIFVINQDSIDGSVYCINPSYGVDPPALAATWLSHPITKSIGYHNDFSVLGNPETSDDYYDFLRAIWKDGSPLAVDSLNPDGYQGADTVDFYFPGTSDSSVSGQPSNWWWNANLDPTDIRMIGSIGPFNLPSQGVISLDFVYNFLPYNGSDEDGEGRLALSNSVQSIIDLFTNGTITSANQPEFEAVEITISPNPFHDFTTVRCNGKFEILKLMDITGRVVFQQQIAHQTSVNLNRNELPDGVYLLQLSSPNQQFTSKIIIQ